MLKRVIALWGAVLVLLLSAPEAYAAREKTGDIEVTLYYGEQPITGGTLTAIRVGNAEFSGTGVTFRRIPDGAAVELPASAEGVREMEKHLTGSGHTFEKRTVSVRDGRAIFRQLPVGLYLIRQEKAAEGFYPVNAFLVSLPYFENGVPVYQVTARSKTELRPKPTPTVPEVLPQTGQRNGPVPALAAGGMVLLCCGWLLNRREGT